jgi:hypothetical protein
MEVINAVLKQIQWRFESMYEISSDLSLLHGDTCAVSQLMI